MIDPPYNISVTSNRDGKRVKNDWDTISDYDKFCEGFIQAAHRVLKDNGVLYIWHSEMVSISRIIAQAQEIGFTFVSFCIWNKGESFRARSWKYRDPDSATSLRSWFNTCEYCLHFFKVSKAANKWEQQTGLKRVYSDPRCFKALKEWYANELQRLNLTEKEIAEKYNEVTGKKPHMLRHYFRDSQFAIPTEGVYNGVYRALGFNKTYEALRQEYEALRQEYEALRQEYEALRQEYEALRQEYEALRQEYEALRHYHRCDYMHNNVWNIPRIPTQNRLHTCQKPVEILRRIVRVSSPPNGVVLDFFMGSGSTGVAAIKEDRCFIGIEKDEEYFKAAKERIEIAKKEPEQIEWDIPQMTQRRTR